MNKNEKVFTDKRYTLATRDVCLEAIIVTGIMLVGMIIWACLVEDKNLLFIPLLFLAVLLVCFISLLIRYFTEPKIAIQANSSGIFLYYSNKKEVFIKYKDIVKVSNLSLRNKYGKILIYTKTEQFESIRTKETGDILFSKIESLLKTDNKEKYLINHSL